MVKYNIPTASYKSFNNYADALEYVKNHSLPTVIKYDGLAAGKGVVIATTYDEAVYALKDMLLDDHFGHGKVVIEEYLEGPEFSFMCFVNGENVYPLQLAQDHKRAYDNDLGPNTGGMGSVSPNPFLQEEVEATFRKDILDPFMKGLAEDQMDYRGVVFIGLMVDQGKAKVLEFNVRFGDPETQAILMRLDSDLFDIMWACANKKLKDVEVKWSNDTVTCVVLASGGYPGSYEKGKVITGLDQLDDDIVVFHAGTALKDGQLVTNGGRVLNICNKGKDLTSTREKVYQAIEKIHFDGMYCRKDIGLH